MKYILTTLFLALSLCAHSQEAITAEDLSLAIGNWEGNLTYLDYQSGEPYTMPANLSVEQGKDKNSLILNYIYPNEPKANSSDKIKITKNGTLLNKHLITSRKELENGHVQIQTEHNGKDDNKKALIQYTYIMGDELFIMRKEVQFEEEGKWIKRNEFKYSKKK